MTPSPWIRFLLGSFTFTYFLAAGLWSLPVNSLEWARQLRESFARPVLKSFSLYQNWSMFAPDPLTIDRTVEAWVTYDTGEEIKFLLPTERSGWIVERIRGEQLRKWSVDHLRLDQNRAFWKATASYYARIAREQALIQDSSQAPKLPTQIRLVRHWTKKISPNSSPYDPAIELSPTQLELQAPGTRYTPGMEPRFLGTPHPRLPGPNWMSYTFYTERLSSTEARK